MSRAALPCDPLALSLAHDLRQGLAVILAYVQLLEAGALGGADRALALAEIRAAVAQLDGALARRTKPDPGPRSGSTPRRPAGRTGRGSG